MSYQKQNFTDGQVLAASQLNHIEDGLADVDVRVTDVDERVAAVENVVGDCDVLKSFVLINNNGILTPYDEDFFVRLDEALVSGYTVVLTSATGADYGIRYYYLAERLDSVSVFQCNTGTEIDILYIDSIGKIERQVIASTLPRITWISVLASNWEGVESPYSQVVDIEGITEYSKVDLLPSVEQLTIFHNKDVAFVTENDGGIVTVYAIGDKPILDYTIQAQITEVSE